MKLRNATTAGLTAAVALFTATLSSSLPKSVDGFSTSKQSIIRKSPIPGVEVPSETTRLNAATPSDRDLERFQAYGEASRQYRRSYFSQSDWMRARDTNRKFKYLITLPSSGIARQLAKEVTVVTGISTAIVIWNALFSVGYQDLAGVMHDPIFGADSLMPILRLPTDPFTLSSSALGLLLVFRTNTAYQRWDEGRKAWGAIINSCRTCLRTGTTWAEMEPDVVANDPYHKQKLERLADAVWAFPRSLMYHLLGPLEDAAAYSRDLQQLKDQGFAEDLLAVRHKPTRALKEITETLDSINYRSVVYQAEVEKAVTVLCDSLGACERIFTSPVPVFYSRHTARYLVVWVFLLPLALYQPFASSWNHWGMIPASVIIAYFLLGIDELSAQMEEPFSILPMEKMTGGIRLSVDEHVDWKDYAEDSMNRDPSFYQLDLRR